MRRTVITALALTLTAAVALAQEPAKKAPLSPPAKSETTLAGKKVTVNYNAPSKRGRAIFGADTLVPYGKIWRTGANQATTLKTETDLMIGTLHVPAGTYSLFTIPAADGWTLIVNKQTGQWGTSHDASQDLGRVKMKVRTVKTPAETLKIEVKPEKGTAGNLVIAWDTVEASVPVAVH